MDFVLAHCLILLTPEPIISLILSTMPPTETTSLLPHSNGPATDTSNRRRSSALISPEGQPSWVSSYKWFFFGSYFNILLVFVPLSVLAHHLNWDVALRFSFSFIAIMPLAKVRHRPESDLERKADHICVVLAPR